MYLKSSNCALYFFNYLVNCQLQSKYMLKPEIAQTLLILSKKKTLLIGQKCLKDNFFQCCLEFLGLSSVEIQKGAYTSMLSILQKKAIIILLFWIEGLEKRFSHIKTASRKRFYYLKGLCSF